MKSFEDIERIDCSQWKLVFGDFLRGNKATPFDLSHLSWEQLACLPLEDYSERLLFSAWKRSLQQCTQDELCRVQLPYAWLKEFEKDAKESLQNELMEALIESWGQQIEQFNTFLIYFQKRASFSLDSFRAFAKALQRIEQRWLQQGKQPKMSLMLNSHQLNDAHLLILLDTLKGSQSLVTLVLNDNYITCRGVQLLAEWVEENDSLRVLQLQGNPIRDAGVLALARSLQQNRGLKAVQLSYEDLEAETIATLHKVREVNRSLEILKMLKERRQNPTFDEC